MRLARLKRENALLQRQLGILLATKAVGDIHNHLIERKPMLQPEEYINKIVKDLSGAMLQERSEQQNENIKTISREGKQHRDRYDIKGASRSKDTSSKRDGHRSRSKDTSSKRDGHRSRSKDTSSKRDRHRNRSKDTSSKTDRHRNRSKDTSSKRDGHRNRSKDTSSKRDGHRNRSKDTSSKRDGHRHKRKHKHVKEEVEQRRSSMSNETPRAEVDSEQYNRRLGIGNLMEHLKDRMADKGDNGDTTPMKNNTSKTVDKRRHRSRKIDKSMRRKGKSKGIERKTQNVDGYQVTSKESNPDTSPSKPPDRDTSRGTEQGIAVINRLTDIASSLLPRSGYVTQPVATSSTPEAPTDHGHQTTDETIQKSTLQGGPSNTVTAPPAPRHIERHDLPFMPDLPPFKPGEFTIWKKEEARKAMIKARAALALARSKNRDSSDSDT